MAAAALGLAAALGCAGGIRPSTGPRPVRALQAELDSIFADPVFHNAQWGVLIQSTETGQILYRRNADKLLMPASNQKLITAAVTLARLGPEHRFQTAIAAAGPAAPGAAPQVTSDGTLNGDLVVIGAGDPSISGRFSDGDPSAVFRAWADSLKARGITRISGDIVGDDDLFDDVPLGPGWSWDDLPYAFAAEIGALLYNEGAVALRFAPADSVGGIAGLELNPPTGYLTVRNEVVTVADSTDLELNVDRRPFTNDVRATGRIWIGADSVVHSVAVHDPTLFFVTALRETLEAEGIQVDGRALDADSLPDYVRPDSTRRLFVHSSPPLAEIVRPFLKESQNQIGEMLLRDVGAAATDTGSVETGRRVVRSTLDGWGIPRPYYIYRDGSGVSRYNYVAPEALVRLLRVMAHRDEFQPFYDALPIAGVDGTLEHRMRGTRAEGNARAKTGYVSNARTLSGYVTTADGERLAFSLMANNFQVPAAAVEYLQDLTVERLANFSRRSPR